MVYKIEGTGITRKVTAKLDKKFLSAANQKETFEVVWLQDKNRKKITVNFILNNNIPVLTFQTHSKQDISVIETIISMAVDYAEMLIEVKTQYTELGESGNVKN